MIGRHTSWLIVATALLLPRVCLAGAWNTAGWQYWNCTVDSAKFAADYVDHPVIQPYGTPAPRPARTAAEVETYFYKLNGWSDIYSKSFMEEWNVIAPGSKPKYKVDPLAQVVVYLAEKDDERGVAMLREEVAKLGAEAMVDVVRVVCVDPMPVGKGQYSLWYGSSYKHPVVGWGYYGVAAVRRANDQK